MKPETCGDCRLLYNFKNKDAPYCGHDRAAYPILFVSRDAPPPKECPLPDDALPHGPLEDDGKCQHILTINKFKCRFCPMCGVKL